MLINLSGKAVALHCGLTPKVGVSHLMFMAYAKNPMSHHDVMSLPVILFI